MEGRFFLPFRYDSASNQFVPEFYTNMAENVYYSNSDLPDVETVKQALDAQNIDLTKLKQFPLMFTPDPRYIYATGDTQLTVLPYCTFALQNGTVHRTEQEITLNADDLDVGTGFEYGKDYYVYIVDAGTIAPDVKFAVSLSPNAPNGAAITNSRKIGGFHYGEVRNVNAKGEEINTSGVVRGTGWEGNTKTAIVPNSVWTEKHRPVCSPEGMVYVTSGFWSDIYLASMDENGKPVSAYNQLPTTGTEGFNWYTFVERAIRVGKRLPSHDEFISLAASSPQGNDGNNVNAWSAKTNSARNQAGLVKNAVSNVGVRDAVGNVWKWLNEFAHDPAGTTGVWHDVFSGYGKVFTFSATGLRALCAGGIWTSGTNAGSRTVSGHGSPWGTGVDIGALLVCDAL